MHKTPKRAFGNPCGLFHPSNQRHSATGGRFQHGFGQRRAIKWHENAQWEEGVHLPRSLGCLSHLRSRGPEGWPVFAEYQHRNFCLTYHVLGYTAEDPVAHAGSSMAGHDNHVGPIVCGSVEYSYCWSFTPHGSFDREPGEFWQTGLSREIGLSLGGALGDGEWDNLRHEGRTILDRQGERLNEDQRAVD